MAKFTEKQTKILAILGCAKLRKTREIVIPHLKCMLGKHVDVVLGEGELNFIFYYMEGGLLVVRGGVQSSLLAAGG